jgi:DNA-binding Xre family transcriptional regulator
MTITCTLKQILDDLPPQKPKVSLRAHARNAEVDWQVFLRMLYNRNNAADLEVLRKLRAYLATRTDAVQPGETRFHLAELMKEKKLIRDKLVEGTGKQNLVTFSRMSNNTMQRADFGVMEALCEFLELDSLEQLLDTGGLLVWTKSPV